MYKVSSTTIHTIVAKGLFEKGINNSITLEKAEDCFKAVNRFAHEIDAYNEAVKVKVNAYNQKLEEAKKEFGENNLPVSILQERDQLNVEVEEQRKKVIEFTLPDDEYRALTDVCENAKKIWFKAMQDKNSCEDMEKQAKIQAPTGTEFLQLSEFIDQVKDAEKIKQ